MTHTESADSVGSTDGAVGLTIELPVEFVGDLSRAESLSDVLDVVTKWLWSVFKADRVSILLAESDAYLRMIVVQGTEVASLDTLVPIEGTMVGQVYRRRESVYASCLGQCEGLDCHVLKREGMNCCLSVPLLSDIHCCGTMNAASATRDAFGDADRQRFQALALWVAASVRIHHQIEKMVVLSETDPLTGVFNRRAFSTRLASLANVQEYRNICFGIAMVDLDHFKVINDTYGHEIGDRVLVEVSRVLTGCGRKSDLVARMGGEEFCVVMADTDEAGMLAMLRRFSAALENLDVEYDGQRIVVTASIGAILIEGDNHDLEFMIGQADEAMYRAKGAGRNCIEFAHICD
ncbi:sensor domain-containing diguanylate cyclase [Halomonas sp. V046]|uniref:sensor domain-containing diguanylate cyclase n=1 Tax=Halomonas sp. V046 TaxID=3459611 RepID=UPI00404489A0